MSQVSPDPQMVKWSPHTKLAFGLLNDNTLVRYRVLATLHDAICDFRLILLVAPTGYGKSTLLNLWIEANAASNEASDAMQVAYLSLDATENDRTHFLLALIAALQTLHPSCGQRAQTFLTQKGYPEPIDEVTQIQILTDLILVDIVQFLPQSFVLILDNYEQISEATIHGALNYLLRRLPSHAHIVVSSTQVPPVSLATMKAHRLATVLQAETLAFDEIESIAFLDKVVALPLSDEQKLILHQYTEGWPTGLHLLAQELRAQPRGAALRRSIASLKEGHAPPLIGSAVQAYLCEELFDSLPQLLRTFLMQTSILSTLNAKLCRAVTGSKDAAELLQMVNQRNLFLFRCPADRDVLSASPSYTEPRFRYHTLFATFLRSRLYQELPDQVGMLHQRAAKVVHEPVQKLQHYLAAQCWS